MLYVSVQDTVSLKDTAVPECKYTTVNASTQLSLIQISHGRGHNSIHCEEMTDARSRGWCFTLNNFTAADREKLWGWQGNEETRPDHLTYFVVGEEVGDSGTPHLQGFLYFAKHKKSFNQVTRLVPRAHFEAMRGTPKQASDYCKKDGNFVEWGDCPLDNKEKGLKGKEAFEEMMKESIELVRNNNYAELAPSMTSHIKAIEYRILKEEQAQRNLDTLEGDLPHEWYYGPAGTGKSRAARDAYPDAYLKMCNKWWDGYRGEDFVLIEDFDRQHSVLVHHLKIWADRYAFPAEIKGGSLKIRPKKIIITSNWHPQDIWTEAGDLEPILRRFNLRFFHHTPRMVFPSQAPTVLDFPESQDSAMSVSEL